MTKPMVREFRTSHGWYREEYINGVKIRLYLGDTMNRWLELTGDPWQSDIEEEIKKTLGNTDTNKRR